MKLYNRFLKAVHFLNFDKNLPDIRYWQQRAQVYGRRSVLNLDHSNDGYDAVTAMQKREIYPYFQKALYGNEKVVLDFGCGPGRFTADLAMMIKGKAIGIDPIKGMLELAPEDRLVEYKLMRGGKIPLPESCVDVVWACLVFGALRDEYLTSSVAEIKRVLKHDGLVFLVENTSELPNKEYWFYRSIPEYQKLFAFAGLKHLHDYYDLHERISIMAGRKEL